jgi:nucleotide-binding universal stress UspA family protein
LNEPTNRPPEMRAEDLADLDQSATADSIVVGHDGSTGAAEALDLALGLAEALKAPLVIARSWSIDTAPKAPDEEFGYVSSFAEISAVVDSMVRANTRTTVEAHPSVTVEYRVALGQPAETLIRIAARARMLVVGSRGLGGFRSLLLGSVSEQCVRHALCPVLVVRPRHN